MQDATSRWARMAQVSESIAKKLAELRDDRERAEVAKAIWEAHRPRRESQAGDPKKG